MTRVELKQRLQGRVDEYNATLAPDVHVRETARAGLNLLREAAGLVTTGDEDSYVTDEQRIFAREILAAINEGRE